ncbi:unnamed protein product [Merluccius merluccius]
MLKCGAVAMTSTRGDSLSDNLAGLNGLRAVLVILEQTFWISWIQRRLALGQRCRLQIGVGVTLTRGHPVAL